MQNDLTKTTPTKSHSQYVITSALRTLEILCAFGQPPHRYSLAELVGSLKLDKGQGYRSLKTLEEAGFLHLDEDGRFALTPLLSTLGVAATKSENVSLTEAAVPVLNWLASETGETVHLFAHVLDRAVCIGIRESQHSVRLSAALGVSAPLHAGASPKAILAFLAATEQDRIIREIVNYPKYTVHTLTDAEQLKAELARVHVQGYAVSDEDVDADARGVGAPIFDLTGSAVGAISVGGPSYRIDDTTLQHFSTLIVQGAQAISRQLGYAG